LAAFAVAMVTFAYAPRDFPECRRPLYRIGHDGTLVIERAWNVVEHKGQKVPIPNMAIIAMEELLYPFTVVRF
jgi:hypothetical protein